MRKLCRVSKKRKTSNDVNEMLLADENYSSDFAKNKECFHCGKKGHLRAQCPKLKDKHGGTPSGKGCELCGQMGHTKKICLEDPKNARQRPRHRVSRLKNKTGEVAAVCVDIFL